MSEVKLTWTEGINKFDEMTTGEDGQWYRKDLPPGSASWDSFVGEDDIGVLRFVCPSGCGKICTIPVKHKGAWTWDGNKTEPTLTPSILLLSGCRWHGYLTKGIFRSV